MKYLNNSTMDELQGFKGCQGGSPSLLQAQEMEKPQEITTILSPSSSSSFFLKLPLFPFPFLVSAENKARKRQRKVSNQSQEDNNKNQNHTPSPSLSPNINAFTLESPQTNRHPKLKSRAHTKPKHLKFITINHEIKSRSQRYQI
ncbi:hypothetical protein Dimus_039337 [Dionaea muscipula]